MQVFPSQLTDVLDEGLRSVYVIGGTESVLEDEASRQILEAAKQDGIEEHEILRFDEGSSRGSTKAQAWGGVMDELAESSLFGARKLIEVRLRSAAFGDGAITAFESFAATSSTNMLLVRLSGLDYREKRKKWYGQLRSAREIVFVVVDELNQAQTVQWLQTKAKSLDLKLTGQAAEKLAAMCEGNLLAARQELDKFQLLLENGATVDLADIDLAASSNADLLEVVDAVFAGNTARVARQLDVLNVQARSSSRHELGILSMVTQVLTLAHAKILDPKTTVPNFQRRRVERVIDQHGYAGIEQLLLECAQFNSMLLGMARGEVANQLRDLLFAIGGSRRSELEQQYPWRKIDRAVN